MLEISNECRYSSNSNKSEKIQKNLSRIKNLLNQALHDLKKSDRTSTGSSDNSENHSMEFIHRISIDLNAQKIQMMLSSLQKGYIMVKHSPNTKPKEKYIYISDDKRFLCWKSLEKDDQKRIDLKKIDLILSGCQQVLPFIKSKTLKKLETCVIVKSQIRNLQLQTLNDEQSWKFKIQLDQAIKNARGLHLSYQV